jgi:hypothetical protein
MHHASCAARVERDSQKLSILSGAISMKHPESQSVAISRPSHLHERERFPIIEHRVDLTQGAVRRLEMRRDVPIILRQCNEGGHQHAMWEAIRAPQRVRRIETMTIECNQVQSSATECNQVQSSEITWSARRTEATAILAGIQLPSAITCGERGGAVVSTCMRAGETRRDPSAERCAERDVPRACNEGGHQHQHAMREVISMQ